MSGVPIPDVEVGQSVGVGVIRCREGGRRGPDALAGSRAKRAPEAATWSSRRRFFHFLLRRAHPSAPAVD